MTDQHRATDEQWAQMEELALHPGQLTCPCLLELRDRIQQLEAAQQAHDRYAGRPSNMTDAQRKAAAAAPSPLPSTLVERVANAIYSVPLDSEAEARAAIREVAKWLIEQDPEPKVVGRLLGQISTPCGVMADLLMHEADK